MRKVSIVGDVLLLVLCFSLFAAITFAKLSKHSSTMVSSTPNLEAYNHERAVRLKELRQATVFVYPDIVDPRLAKEETVADALRDASRKGSGVLVDPVGVALTNAHVVKAACPAKPNTERYCTIATFDHKRAYKVRVEKVDEQHDIALLRVVDPGFTTFSTLPIIDEATESRLEGREVLVVGQPFGKANTATNGTISNFPDVDEFCRPYQVRAVVPIAPGNSGGAMVDLGTGAIVGLVTSVYGVDSVERTEQGDVRRVAMFLNLACALHPTYIRSFLGR